MLLLVGNDDAVAPLFEFLGVELGPRLHILALGEQFHGVAAVGGRLLEALAQPLRRAGGDEGVHGVMAVVVAPLPQLPCLPEFSGHPSGDCADADFAFVLLVVEIGEVAAGG